MRDTSQTPDTPDTADTPGAVGTAERAPEYPDSLDASQLPTRWPLWRRVLRRDAGFSALVLMALLVTVLIISRIPTGPSTTSTTSTTASTPTTATTAASNTPASGAKSTAAAIAHPAHAQIIPMPTSRAGLMQPAVDAQGNIWVGEMNINKLARIDPKTGQVSEWTPPNGKYNIMQSAVGRHGDVWFTEQAANYIGRFDPTTETFKIYSLDSAVAPRMAPQDLTFDASGNLWFTMLGGRIGRLNPATGAIQSWQVPPPQGASRAYPYCLAATPSEVWFGYLTGGAVGKLDLATNKITLLPLASHQAAVYAMAADASGRIWFTEMDPAILGHIDPATNKVTELPVPDLAGDPSMLYGLKTTAAGSVWFASAGANSVVHYELKEDLFTFYQFPASQSIPFGMALGHDNSIWVSGDGAADNYVARITP